jgi:hypothetical protein
MKAIIPDGWDKAYKDRCINCVWNSLKGISKTHIQCSRSSCILNIEANRFKKRKD